MKSQRNNNNILSLRLKCDEVSDKIDEEIIEMIECNSKDTYCCTKQVSQHVTPDLINALDQNQISITKASQVARLPLSEQSHFLSIELKGVTYESKNSNSKT